MKRAILVRFSQYGVGKSWIKMSSESTKAADSIALYKTWGKSVFCSPYFMGCHCGQSGFGLSSSQVRSRERWASPDLAIIIVKRIKFRAEYFERRRA
jgi:hypothetical protein